MRVAFLYNRAAEDPTQSADDDDPERSPVVAALRGLGHEVTPIACTLDLAAVQQRVLRAKPNVVFNRVESLGGSDSMMAAIPLLLEAMEVPFTGNSSAALVGTASKTAVKERLVRAGLPTPPWVDAGVESAPARVSPQFEIGDRKFIIKAVYEHASFEIGDASVVEAASAEELLQMVRECEARTSRAHFAELFIPGREFNLSILAGEVLPPAEIDFSAFPADKLRIVDQRAKWDEESFEYNFTPRRFDFSPRDRPLLDRLVELAGECVKLFDLCGYSRVDFRCDEAGEPWILEINTNPCILPDAGFAAALENAGIDYAGGLARILDDALARRKTPAPAGDDCVAGCYG
jgi:D-alanine-D-alanine ligase